MLLMKNWAFDIANENWALDVANKKLGFDVANEKLGFGGMRYVQWAHRADFAFRQVLKKKIGPNMWFLALW